MIEMLQPQNGKTPLLLLIIFGIILVGDSQNAAAFSPDKKVSGLNENHSLEKNAANLSSYFHLRYSYTDNSDVNPWSMRRFKMFAKTKINKKWQLAWQLIYKRNHNHKTDDRIYLQHLYLKYAGCDAIQFKFGQFKPPFGWERFQPDCILPNIERAKVVDKLIPAGSLGASFARDYGFQIEGHFPVKMVQYELAAMSGNGANNKITTINGPLWIARFSLRQSLPFWKSVNSLMQLALSRRKSQDIDFTGQLPGTDHSVFLHFAGIDERFNFAWSLKNNKTQLAAEYIWVRFRNSEQDKSLRADGYSVQLSHFFGDKFQFVTKFERFDPDHAMVNSADMNRITIGVDYYPDKTGTRIMINYIHQRENSYASKNDVMILQYQYFLFRN